MTTEIKGLLLFILNVAPAISVAGLAVVSDLADGLAATAAILDISDIIQSFEHNKSNHSKLKTNQAISQSYSNISMEQHLLYLMYYHQLVCFLLFLSYIQRTHLLLT